MCVVQFKGPGNMIRRPRPVTHIVLWIRNIQVIGGGIYKEPKTPWDNGDP